MTTDPTPTVRFVEAEPTSSRRPTRRRFLPGDRVTITLDAVVASNHRLVHENQHIVRVDAHNGIWDTPIEAIGLVTEPEPDTTVVDRNGDEWRRYGTDPGGRHWRCQTPVDGEYMRESWVTVTGRFGPVQRERTHRRRTATDGGPV